MTNEEAIEIIEQTAVLRYDRIKGIYSNLGMALDMAVQALENAECLQNFGDMINDHADDTWTGEKIVQALVHRGLYHKEFKKKNMNRKGKNNEIQSRR